MSKLLPPLEIMAWLLGTALFAAYGASAYWSTHARDESIADFAKAHYQQSLNRPDAAAPPQLPGSNGSATDSAIDMSAWSKNRIDAYFTHSAPGALPEAVLRIPSIRLVVPVFAGTSELTLNRGAGRIEGTPRFGDWGNTGIAAHRDGFFRALRDIRQGDGVYLDLPHGTVRYKVASTRIVEPSDIGVLRDSGEPMITLVTCYPFYFVGSAPKRFIVHAKRVLE